MKSNALDLWESIAQFNIEIIGVDVLQENELAFVYRLKTAGTKNTNIIAKLKFL